MRKIKIEKVVLSIGGTSDTLDKGFRLLKFFTGKKPAKIKSMYALVQLRIAHAGRFARVRRQCGRDRQHRAI